MTEAPKRRWEIQVSVGGDTRDDAIAQLRHMLHSIEDGSNGRIASGGCSAGGHAEVTERPDMTHERYFEQLTAYLEERDAEKEAAYAQGVRDD